MSQKSLSSDCWLSCDHTYKSVSNIGSVRLMDNKWVNQYTGLFCILNAAGNVITWKMTKALSFEHVEDVLISLRTRLQSQQKQVQVTKLTPPPKAIHQQLIHFQSEWEGIKYNDRHVLPPAAIKEIKCLLVHVDKGCISGIYPGRGTNKNKRLHRDIKLRITNTRYGVELEYAILTEILFSHNECLDFENGEEDTKAYHCLWLLWQTN